MEIPKQLNDEIWDYCRINNIPNINEFIINILRQGFTVEKYGNQPHQSQQIIEKIIEIPISVDNSDLTNKLGESMLEIERLKKELEDSNNKVIQLQKDSSNKKRDLYGDN